MFNSQDERNVKKSAKKGVDIKAGAERRHRQLLSVRHKAHGEMMKHLRSEATDDADPTTQGMQDGITGDPQDVWSYGVKSNPAVVPVSLLPQFVNMVMNGQSRDEVFHGTLMIRKLLAVEKNPPYDAVAQSGVLPYIVALLDRDDDMELQFEASWAVTNISAGTAEHTAMTVQCGCIPKFIHMLGSQSSDCRGQAAWALGNFSGENAQCRDEVLRNGALPAFLTVLSTPDQFLDVMRNATWALSNMCRTKPIPPFSTVAMAFPVLANLINSTDPQLVLDATWGLSFISDGSEERIQALLETGALPRIVDFLAAHSINLRMAAIRIIGNVASGSDQQTQILINAGALIAIAKVLQQPQRVLRKEGCWTISNIAAGAPEQVTALVESGIFNEIMNCLIAPELDVKKEAVWCVANVCLCGKPEEVHHLANIGVIPRLCDTLSTHDAKIVSVSLEALQCFLQLGEDMKMSHQTEENLIAQQVLECGGIDYIEQLQNHQNRDVYALSLQILESFFSTEEATLYGGADNENNIAWGNAAPSGPDANGNQFNF